MENILKANVPLFIKKGDLLRDGNDKKATRSELRVTERKIYNSKASSCYSAHKPISCTHVIF